MVGRLRMTVDEALDSLAEVRESLFRQHPRLENAASKSPFVSETKYSANEAKSTLQSIITRDSSTGHYSSSAEDEDLARVGPFEDQKDRTRT